MSLIIISPQRRRDAEVEWQVRRACFLLTLRLSVSAVLFLFAMPACAQDLAAIAMGAERFRANCAVPYCHGRAGAAGRAPQLAGRSFPRERLLAVIRDGLPNTAMPGFREQLPPPAIDAIAAYVMSLSSPGAATMAGKPARELSPEAKAGRALFFDSTRIGTCGACHATDGWGVAIAPDPAARVPDNVAALQAVKAGSVVLARPQGEAPFAALPAGKSEKEIKVYDLSAKLPVLRTFAPGEATLEAGAQWGHTSTLNLYSATELESILLFLRQLK